MDGNYLKCSCVVYEGQGRFILTVIRVDEKDTVLVPRCPLVLEISLLGEIQREYLAFFSISLSRYLS